MNKQSSELLSDKPYTSFRIGLHDYMLYLTPFFYPRMVHRCYHQTFWLSVLTQCRVYFSTAIFLLFAFNILLILHRSFTAKTTLKKQITLVSAFVNGFFGTVT